MTVNKTPVKRRRIRELVIIFFAVVVAYILCTVIYYAFWAKETKIITQPVNILLKGDVIKLPHDSVMKVKVVEHGILVDKESATLGVNGGVEKGVWTTTSVMIKGQPYVILRLTPQPAEKR